MGKRGVGMHAATSAMIRGTSLPRHLRSGAESSGSVQNPLLRGRSSNHSEPSVDTSYQPSHHSQLPPAALSVTTCSNPPALSMPPSLWIYQLLCGSWVQWERKWSRPLLTWQRSHISPHNWNESVQVRILKYPLHWHVVTAKITGYFGRVNRAVLTCTLHPAPTT